MQGLGNFLRINKPAAPPGAEQSKSLVFSPLPGRLPEVVFHPVHVFHSHIGDEKLAIYQNLHTGTCWGFRRVIARSQSGQVFVAAALVQHPESKQYFYKHPYVLVAVKMESKARVQETQAKLSKGGHGDNSMLDRALITHLATTAAAPHSIRLLECWHDRDHLYSVMNYLCDGDLLDCVAAQTLTRCLDEENARRAIAGALACLHTLHTLGFMHRDISPENIMVDSEGRGVVIDFGSALPMQPHGTSAVPMQGQDAATAAAPPLAGWHAMPPPTAGSVFCKPQYACPWYVWARPWYGVSYDLYSLGTTLFAVLEGRTLYGGPAPAADPAFRAILESDPAAFAAWHMPGCIPVPTSSAGEPTTQSTTPVPPQAQGDLPGMPAPTQQLMSLLQRWNASRPSIGRLPVSEECLDLLGRFLRLTPACRPFTAQDVLAHPWFTAKLPSLTASVVPVASLMPHVHMGVADQSSAQPAVLQPSHAPAPAPAPLAARASLPSMRGMVHPDGAELEDEGDMSPATAMLAQGVRALGVSGASAAAPHHSVPAVLPSARGSAVGIPQSTTGNSMDLS